ncbi:MAG: hypothetical protein JWP78_1354 [Mucilaginibacter sp.]|nr:hypothetical protein [Mucilaginibacter sp.]
MEKPKNNDWQTSDPHVFWGEIAPTDHILQIYENDDTFLDLLKHFVISGIKSNESVVIIATNAHIQHLTERVKKDGYDVASCIASDHLILLEAEETLSKFMVNDWPDAVLFHQTINDIVKRVKAKNRRLRAFGEMVALLWAQGHNGATVRLEDLWNRFCETEAFCLFCAYPKSGFTQDVSASMHNICCAHSKMISGSHALKDKIFYKTVVGF